MEYNISDSNQWRQEQPSSSAESNLNKHKNRRVDDDNSSEYSVGSLADNLAELGRRKPTIPFETIRERSQIRSLQREIHQLRQSHAAGAARAIEESRQLRSQLTEATLKADLAESRAREAEALARAQAAEAAAQAANLSQHAQPLGQNLRANLHQRPPTFDSIRLWQLKQQLKEVKLFYFTGVQDQTTFAKWTTTIDHYSQICGSNMKEKINLAVVVGT